MTIFFGCALIAIGIFTIWSIFTMTAALDRLTASVASLTTAEESLVTLVGNIAQQIRDNVDDSDALNALADTLDGDTKAITDAVVANTPAAPETPAEPAPAGDATA